MGKSKATYVRIDLELLKLVEDVRVKKHYTTQSEAIKQILWEYFLNKEKETNE